jgi:predicted secreted Zn-dependent protease
VKVGAHIVTSLPLWQPSTNANVTLVSKWRTFMTNLTLHEAGHAALDKLYAQQLANQLANLPAMDCALVASTVKSVVSANVAALNQANDRYDTTTNHGATQGAILP